MIPAMIEEWPILLHGPCIGRMVKEPICPFILEHGDILVLKSDEQGIVWEEYMLKRNQKVIWTKEKP